MIDVNVIGMMGAPHRMKTFVTFAAAMVFAVRAQRLNLRVWLTDHV